MSIINTMKEYYRLRGTNMEKVLQLCMESIASYKIKKLAQEEEKQLHERSQRLGLKLDTSFTWVDYAALEQQCVRDMYAYVSKVYQVRQKLRQLSNTKPIDSKMFHSKMHDWQLRYTLSKLKLQHPELLSDDIF